MLSSIGRQPCGRDVSGAPISICGRGAPSATVVKKLYAGTIEIGDLTLRNLPLLIAGHGLAEGIDGVLPLSAFAGFLIRLDIPRKSLELLPYPPNRRARPGGSRRFRAIT